MTYPDTISVYHKLTHAPTTTSSSSNSSPSSFQLSCIVLSHAHQRVAATTEEDLVVYDYKSGRRSALPDFVATAFARIWELQDAESRAARNEIAALEESVRAIERATWDREDAVEDMGVLKR